MKPSTPPFSIFVLMAAAGVLLGVRVFFVFDAPPPALLQYAGKTAAVEGVVADDPDKRINALRVMLSVRRVGGEEAQGTILAVLPRDAVLGYGDRVVVHGALKLPEPFETNTGRTFDYPTYLKARGISLLVSNASLQEAQTGPASLERTLFGLKHRFEAALERVMRQPQAALMEGFLLGERSSLPQGLTQAFVLTGLIHVVVLSGYNIGIIAHWASRLFGYMLSRRAALVCAGVVIVLFAVLSGGGMATLRATAMGIVSLLARYLERPAAAMRALMFAAAALVAWNPLVVLDAGFVLSVLATFGLIALGARVEEALSFIPWRGVRSAAATTIAVELYILPALLYFTGVLSLVSVPANALFLPLVPFAMLLGAVAGALALIFAPLALLPAFGANLLLGVMIWFTKVAAATPFAAYTVPAFPWWVAALTYVPLTAWASVVYRRSASPAQTSLDS